MVRKTANMGHDGVGDVWLRTEQNEIYGMLSSQL